MSTIILNSCDRKKNTSDSDSHLNSVLVNYSKIKFFYDLDKAFKSSLGSGKKLLVYFNSSACVNCRSYEKGAFFDKEIIDLLLSDYVVCVLFVDSLNLIEGNGYSVYPNENFEMEGEYNSALQIFLLNESHQPSLAIFNDKMKVQSIYKGDLLNLDSFLLWLRNNVQEIS